MKNTTQQVADLLGFLIKDAERHGLTEIRISVARARTILADLETPTPKTLRMPRFFDRLDEIHAL